MKWISKSIHPLDLHLFVCLFVCFLYWQIVSVSLSKDDLGPPPTLGMKKRSRFCTLCMLFFPPYDSIYVIPASIYIALNTSHRPFKIKLAWVLLLSAWVFMLIIGHAICTYLHHLPIGPTTFMQLSVGKAAMSNVLSTHSGRPGRKQKTLGSLTSSFK